MIIYLMSIVPLTVNLLLAYVVWQQLHESQQLTKRVTQLEQDLSSMVKDCRLLVKADVDMEHQIQALDKQLVSMDKHIQSLENVRANDGGYQHALRILEMGGSKEEVVQSCHLSNAEAELLMNLNAYRKVIEKA